MIKYKYSGTNSHLNFIDRQQAQIQLVVEINFSFIKEKPLLYGDFHYGDKRGGLD